MNSEKNKRIAKNTGLLYIRMLFTMALGLYTSRIILDTLGVTDFGIYNVVGGVVSMFTFLSGAMSSSTQRFLSFEIGKNDLLQLNKTFNAALVIHAVIAVIILLFAESIGLWFLNNYLNIPVDRMIAAKWVYHLSAFSILLSVLRTPYHAIIIAYERMNIYAYISIFSVSMKLLIVFMLMWISFDKLKLFGILIFVLEIIITILYLIYVRYHFPETKLIKVKDRKLFKTLIGYSGWNLFGNIALVAKGQGVTIILNIFFGPAVNAAQAIANQVNSAVQSFYWNFQTAANPQIIKSYSADDKKYMISLILSISKFSYYLLFTLSLPILLEIDIILDIWLVNVPEYTSSFTILILIMVLIDCISGPLMTGIQATGNIKAFQFIVGSLQILLIPFTYLLFFLEYPPQATYIIGILISIISLFIRLHIINSLIDEFSVQKFFHEVIFRNVLITLVSLVIPICLKFFLDSSIFNFIIITTISVISSVIYIYLLGLKHEEKTLIHYKFRSLLNKLNMRS